MALLPLYNVKSGQMDSPAGCVTQRAIRKTAKADRVNRVMRFRVLRTVIVVVGAAALLAVPITLVLGHVPATSATSTSLVRPLAAESDRDFDDHQAQLASRVPPPAATAATATTTAPSHAASPAPVRVTVPALSH